MRKLKLHVQMSGGGPKADTSGKTDWLVWDWDHELKEYFNDLTESIDCIFLGRKTAGGFIAHWAKVAENPDGPQFAFARNITEPHKVIFTKTPAESKWYNIDIATTQ